MAEPPAAVTRRDEVLAQLELLLASPYFSSSKRCPAMLRHVVLRTLDGLAHELKERTLGVEVFHRAPDYDTNVDPVVRLVAGDIRKRLAQYYCEPEHETALRILLPSGSYVPEFHRHESPHMEPPALEEVLVPPVHARVRRPAKALALAGVAMLALVPLGLGARHFLVRSAFDRFWGPVRSSKTPALICVGQPDRSFDPRVDASVAEQDSLAMRTLSDDRVTTSDAMAAGRISGVLGRQGISYSLQGSDSTTFSDMRKGANILVSGADNQWTLRAVKDLRFHFQGEPNGKFARIWIADRKSPSRRDWIVDFAAPYSTLSQDYAIVGRFFNAATGQITVVAAGIGANGTQSAAECVSDENCLQQIANLDLSRGSAKNLEAVIGTQVIDGKSGPPSVLAVQSW